MKILDDLQKISYIIFELKFNEYIVLKFNEYIVLI